MTLLLTPSVIILREILEEEKKEAKALRQMASVFAVMHGAGPPGEIKNLRALGKN